MKVKELIQELGPIVGTSLTKRKERNKSLVYWNFKILCPNRVRFVLTNHNLFSSSLLFPFSTETYFLETILLETSMSLLSPTSVTRREARGCVGQHYTREHSSLRFITLSNVTVSRSRRLGHRYLKGRIYFGLCTSSTKHWNPYPSHVQGPSTDRKLYSRDHRNTFCCVSKSGTGYLRKWNFPHHTTFYVLQWWISIWIIPSYFHCVYVKSPSLLIERSFVHKINRKKRSTTL